MNNHILLIIGMALATYIPRLLPLVIVSKEHVPVRVRRFLLFIPYTALGALIIPGVFSATPEMPLASIVGFSIAFIYAWLKGGIIITVLGSIITTFIMLLIK